MKPNDENGKLPPEQRPFRVLVLSGSDRRQYNCPGVDSKSRALMLRMADRLPQGQVRHPSLEGGQGTELYANSIKSG